jgi:hypothetical protein
LRVGSANCGHSKANFSRQPSERIHRRMNSSIQWHTSRPALRSLVTRFTSALRWGIISGALRLSSISGGNKSLLGHWGASGSSTWNHLREDPFHQPLKEQKLVRPLGRIGQFHMEPPSGRPLPSAPEGGIWVFVMVVVPQSKRQAIKQLMLIMSRRVKIPKKRSVWWDG